MNKIPDGIEKIVIDEGMNYSRLNNGLPTKKHTPQYLIDRCNYIQKTQDDLKHGLTVKEFLKMFPKCFEELQYTVKKLITDYELDSIEDEPNPSILDINRKNEETAGIHKSLKHLENITNKIDSRLSTGQVTINTWLQRKKKGRKKTNSKNLSKQLKKSCLSPMTKNQRSTSIEIPQISETVSRPLIHASNKIHEASTWEWDTEK
ncbi:hypothetical protein G9C98_008265 [Cotesia typhae]|uniref:Uncharacterized protein n=1 Tax=Cotesia typhae TaxID=2053667 RepID=A0A8J5QUP6_9HYME|nr:hypothetical protein G9C98_008265 [Cotesia typhae]